MNVVLAHGSHEGEKAFQTTIIGAGKSMTIAFDITGHTDESQVIEISLEYLQGDKWVFLGGCSRIGGSGRDMQGNPVHEASATFTRMDAHGQPIAFDNPTVRGIARFSKPTVTRLHLGFS